MSNPCDGFEFPVYTQVMADEQVSQEGMGPGMVHVHVVFSDGDELVYEEDVTVDREYRRMETSEGTTLHTLRGCDAAKFLYIESYVVNHICGYPPVHLGDESDEGGRH